MYCSLLKHSNICFFCVDVKVIAFTSSSLIKTHLLLLGIYNDDFRSLLSVSVDLS